MIYKILLPVRKALGQTQQQMARKLMLSCSIYALYEQGRRKVTEEQRLQTLVVKAIREHQSNLEQLKLSVAAVKCTENCTNGGE